MNYGVIEIEDFITALLPTKEWAAREFCLDLSYELQYGVENYTSYYGYFNSTFDGCGYEMLCYKGEYAIYRNKFTGLHRNELIIPEEVLNSL